MGGWNSAAFDDHYHRRGDLRLHWLKHKRPVIRPGVRCRRSKFLVVLMVQRCHMVTDHQNKFITQFGQRTALLPLAGTAQQMKRVFCRPLIGVFGPFVRSEAHRPARL